MRLTFLPLILFISCSTAPDLNKDKEHLLLQHKQSRQLHFERNARALVADNIDPFISVSRGAIDTRRREESEKMFEEYLADADYSAYDDMQEPIVRISPDGQMAWIISRTRVARRKNYAGKVHDEGFVYAGVMMYKKVDGRWMREANVSTFGDVKE